MHTFFKTLKSVSIWLASVVSTVCLAACATIETAPPTIAETLPDAITIPYRISSAGRFVVDISINGHSARPFAVDTGATVSVVYESTARSLNLEADSQSVLVRGLVSIGERPIVEGVTFQIGTGAFPLDQIAILETPTASERIAGLLGTDILADYAIVFNKEAMLATLVPSRFTGTRAFPGWRRIPLRKRVGAYPDYGLHFAQVSLKNRKIPVLIDTGSDLNIVNWHLATLDEDMRRHHRKLREQLQLEGALGSSRLRLGTQFLDLVLGRHYWPEIDVIIMELETLSVVAPVAEPMMIAGAGMFTPWTVAFDLGGDALYIRANPDDPSPPSRDTFIRQSLFVSQSTTE